MPLPAITLTGNLTADPELRFTPSGKPLAKLTIACNDRRKNEAGDWVDGDTTFLDVTSWRNAEGIAEQLKKGDAVVVTGQLKSRTYETKEGDKRRAFEVDAANVAKVLRDRPNTDTWSASPKDNNVWAQTEQAPF